MDSSRPRLADFQPKRFPPPHVQLPRSRLLHDAIFSPGTPAAADSPGSEEDTVPDAGAGLLWQTLEVLQAMSAGEQTNKDLVHSLYQRLASGEYHITSTRAARAAHITERIDAAGHLKDVKAYLAKELGAQILAPNPAEPADKRSVSNESIENADSHLENGSDYDSDDTCSAVRYFPNLLIPEVDRILRTADGWSFNAFHLREATNDQPLATLCFYLLQTTGLIREFDLDAMRLARFLRALESHYSSQGSVLYHSRTHAADVLQSMHVLLTQGGLAELLAGGPTGHRDSNTQLSLLAAYLAAAVHDVNHMGLTNDFLVRTGHALALTYNDASPNENHHVSSAYALMKKPENNFMRRMSKKNAAALRKMIIELVLATDMQKHVAVHTALQTRLAVMQAAERAPSELKRNMNGLDRSFKERRSRMSNLSPTTPTSPSTPNTLNDADRLLLLQGGLKIADLGHLQAPWAIHKEWVERMEEEQFRQGDMEKQLRLPVSPLMDRTGSGITKMQAGFFDFVVVPLLRTFVAICPQTQQALDLVELNRVKWVKLADTVTQKEEEAASQQPSTSDATEPAPSSFTPKRSLQAPPRIDPGLKLSGIGSKAGSQTRFQGNRADRGEDGTATGLIPAGGLSRAGSQALSERSTISRERTTSLERTASCE